MPDLPQRARRLNLIFYNDMKYWKSSELQFMRNNIKMLDKELADALGRSEQSIRMARWGNGIKKHSRISADEMQTIQRTMHMPTKHVAKLIGRSYSTIRRLRHTLTETNHA